MKKKKCLQLANLKNPIFKHIMKEKEHKFGKALQPGKHWNLEKKLDVGDKCTYCMIDKGNSIDEIIACSEGGRMNRMNMVQCCVSCNSSKGSQDPIEWVKNGGNIKKGKPIPAANRNKIIKYIKQNKIFMKTEDECIFKLMAELTEEANKFIDLVDSRISNGVDGINEFERFYISSDEE